MKYDELEQAILARAERRGLTTKLSGIDYANEYLFKDAENSTPANALYVGVGHGLDALLALVIGKVDRIVGVDPYIATHGNDDDDYATLCGLITRFNLQKRFALFKGVIQDYAPNQNEAPDLIIINDVLHHIYETQIPLRKSDQFEEAVAMFAHLKQLAAPEARLVIGDVSRSGLRPVLGRLGVLHPWIDFATKQNWREWDAAARQAGWSHTGMTNYTPNRLRSIAPLFWGPMARYSLCNKYYLYYQS